MGAFFGLAPLTNITAGAHVFDTTCTIGSYYALVVTCQQYNIYIICNFLDYERVIERIYSKKTVLNFICLYKEFVIVIVIVIVVYFSFILYLLFMYVFKCEFPLCKT